MSDLDEPPFMREKIRICERCKGNLLIQSTMQTRKCRGRDAEGEWIRKYTPGRVTWWCPSCERSVNTALIDGWLTTFDSKTDYYSLSHPFPKPTLIGLCVRGEQQETIEEELRFVDVKSPFITELAEVIRELKLEIAQDHAREIARIEARYGDED